MSAAAYKSRPVDALRRERIALADDLAEARRLKHTLEGVEARIEERERLIAYLSEEHIAELMEGDLEQAKKSLPVWDAVVEKLAGVKS